MSAHHPSVEVRPTSSTSTKGRALISTKPIAPGSVILTLRPLILLPALSHLQSVCTYCLRPGEPRACTRCRSAFYCGASCQRDHWKSGHARECKALGKVQAAGRGYLPTPVRLLMQVLLAKEGGDGEGGEGGLREKMDGLEGHVEAWKSGKKWEDVEMMATAACAYAGVGTEGGQVRKATDWMCKVSLWLWIGKIAGSFFSPCVWVAC